VDFLCPSKADSVLFGDCMTDCTENHGAVDGTCGPASQGDYNCYCGKRIIAKKPKSLHCVKKSVGYTNICRMDCLCNHAAVGGQCDWENKACLCEQQGTNKANKGCVASTWHPFTEYIHSQIGHEGLQWVDNPYHWFIKGDKPLPPHSPLRAGWGGWWGHEQWSTAPRNLKAGWWGQQQQRTFEHRHLRAGFRNDITTRSWYSSKACDGVVRGETDSHPDNLVTCDQWCNSAHGYDGGYCSSSYCYCQTIAN